MSASASARVATGLDRLSSEPAKRLRTARVGLLMNQASVNHRWQYAHHLLADALAPNRLVKLFAPQHGIWGVQQANMRETDHELEASLGIPILSLYSSTRRPTPEMLEDIDLLLIDLQDVGTRIYTYVWTVMLCLEACAEQGISVWILDRPNPLGGCVIEGPCLDPAYVSFVGMLPIPMRHGLTIGELASLGNDWLGLGAELEVISMQGWRRDMYYPETGLPWVPPSPNMPRFETAVVYPGQVLLEGTNLSEGRGTTSPFELIGAPFIDARQLRQAWTAAETCGVTPREVRFAPTFDKWQGQTCQGLAWHWDDVAAVRSYAATLSLLAAVRSLWPDEFAWLPPPYEYEFEKPPIDILSGSDRLRKSLPQNAAEDPADWQDLARADDAEWWSRVDSYLLYR